MSDQIESSIIIHCSSEHTQIKLIREFVQEGARERKGGWERGEKEGGREERREGERRGGRERGEEGERRGGRERGEKEGG